MWRRWIIRGSFIGLLLLLVAGWGVSTGRVVVCDYTYDRNWVGCTVKYGQVWFWWRRGWDKPEGWHALYDPHPFRVVDSDFFWLHASYTDPDSTLQRFCCMGFDYYHSTDGLLSSPRDEARAVAIPFWFLIVGTGAGLVWAWKKTRPKLDPRTAFPVELDGAMNAER